MCGPRHPNAPISETVALSPSVMYQDYEDGRLYQISSPRGRSFQAVLLLASKAIPASDYEWAELSGVHDPLDDPRYNGDDKNVYISLWVANN